MPGEHKKQVSFTHRALSASGRAKSKSLSVITCIFVLGLMLILAPFSGLAATEILPDPGSLPSVHRDFDFTISEFPDASQGGSEGQITYTYNLGTNSYGGPAEFEYGLLLLLEPGTTDGTDPSNWSDVITWFHNTVTIRSDPFSTDIAELIASYGDRTVTNAEVVFPDGSDGYEYPAQWIVPDPLAPDGGFTYQTTWHIISDAVPEPTTVSLTGLALTLFGRHLRRKRARKD